MNKSDIMRLADAYAGSPIGIVEERLKRRAALEAALTQGEPDDAPVAMRFPHTSDWDKVTCPTCNATFNVETHPAPVNTALLEKAQAVVDRWDTPMWKDVPATAVFINELRNAIAQAEGKQA